MNELYCQSADGDMAKLSTAARYQEELERKEFYLIDTKIEQVATGLGLTAIKLLRANLYERAFSCSVLTDNPDMLPFVQRKIRVFKQIIFSRTNLCAAGYGQCFVRSLLLYMGCFLQAVCDGTDIAEGMIPRVSDFCYFFARKA